MFEPPPNDTQIKEEPERRFFSGTLVVAAIAAFAIAAFGGYALHEHRVAAEALQQNAAITASLNSTNAQVEQLTAKLNELSAPKPQAVEPLPPSRTGQAAKQANPGKAAQHRSASRRVARDDPRWKKMQSQLDEQGQAIASTRQDLSSTRTELQGSIARTHDELVVLQRKGERRYYEFDIQKGKQFSHAGSMNIKLRKSNEKHQYADLDLLVDDRVVTKKHVNLYEPTMFYASDNEQPVQIVINKVGKDRVHGYVSEPKYSKTELSSMQAESAAQGGTQNKTAAQDSPKLHPRSTVAIN